MKYEDHPVFDADVCVGCGKCVALCRDLGPNAIELVDGKATLARPESCIFDGTCVCVCPTGAAQISSRSHNRPQPFQG